MPDTEGIIDWEDELLSEPLEEPSPWAFDAEPAESSVARRKRLEREARLAATAEPADPAAAAAALREAIKNPPPPPDPATRPDFVPAPPPPRLHEITFPVYDRKAKGYRIIQRAFGTREVKYLLKGLLDSFLGTDDAVDPARQLDATEHLFGHASVPSIHQLARPFKCSRGVIHDTRVLSALVPGAAMRDTTRRHVKRLIEEMQNCVHVETSTNRGDEGGFAYDRTFLSHGARHFVDSHFPFVAVYDVRTWVVTLPAEVARMFFISDEQHTPPSATPRFEPEELTFAAIEDRSQPGWTLI